MIPESKPRINRLFTKDCLVLILSIAYFCLPATAIRAGGDGTARVQVVRKGAIWAILGVKTRLQFDPSDLQITVRTEGRAWSMASSFSGDLIVESDGQRFAVR